MASPETIFITNANEGIGVGLIRYILSTLSPSPRYVIAACQCSPSSAEVKSLRQMTQNYECLRLMSMDLTTDVGINSAFEETDALLKDDGLNLLIFNCGIVDDLGRPGSGILDQQTRADIDKHLLIGATAPIMVAKKFFPLLRKASKKRSYAPLGCGRAAIINISFMFQYIYTSVTTMKSYHYRAARAALSVVTSLLAMELKDTGILVAAIHPGWSDTGASENSEEEDLQDTLKKLWLTMMSLAGESAGMMFNYDGMVLPW